MKIKNIKFNWLLIFLIMFGLASPGMANTINLPTDQIKYIYFKVVSDEIPFGINMYITDSRNLEVNYNKGKALANMTVQDQMQKEFSTNLLFRLQDASSGGCVVSINGTVGDNSQTTVTIDSTAHTKCEFGRVDYSSSSWLLNVEMRMN